MSLVPILLAFLAGLAALASARGRTIDSGVALAREDEPALPLERSFDELGITIRLPATFERINEPSKKPIVDRWRGRVGPCDLELMLLVLDAATFEAEEPEDVNRTWIADLRDPSKSNGARLAFGATECVAGRFGRGGYAAVVHGTVQAGRDVPRGMFLASGLLDDKAWTLRADVDVDPDEEDARAIRALLADAIVCRGAARDPRWDAALLSRRWLRSAPESTRKKLEAPCASEHYVLLTDSPNGPAFAKKLEAMHATVKKLVPFEALAAQRLLPVYLFRTEDDYRAYYRTAFRAPSELADDMRGHVEGAYYVTYFADLDDPLHLYYATLQLLHARLGLDGGGSWFRAGLAKYVSSKPSWRSAAARKARNAEHVPFADLVVLPDVAARTLDEDRTGVDDVEARLAQCASIFEFLHEGKATKGRFLPFVRTVGLVEPGDREALDDALRSVLEVDLAGFETQWVEYCKRR
jgi:hypothetical protein